MYEKLHRWSDEDQAVAVEDREDRDDSDRTGSDDEDRVEIYRRRITPDDE